MKQKSEGEEERSSIAGNVTSLLGFSRVSMGIRAILGNGQSVVAFSKDGPYRIILDPAFSMSAKIISGWVNVIGHIWGM